VTWIAWLVLALVVFGAPAALLWWLRNRLLLVSVGGSSMVPAYRDGDRLLVRRRGGRLVRPGQVVVADAPGRDVVSAGGRPSAPSPDRRIVKRVAAVPGDPVPTGVDWMDPHVPPGKLALFGDNSAVSVDSRHYGFVSVERVIGVAVCRIV
jgi:signal peptidase I